MTRYHSDPTNELAFVKQPAKLQGLKIGELGEQVVALWLISQGWEILQHRWRCRWGEVDLIAQQQSAKEESDRASLIFVEVKTRSRDNWDAGGVLAITPQKQAKLGRTAALFLAENPELAWLPCRFDLALVRSRQLKADGPPPKDCPKIALGQPFYLSGYELTLSQYLKSAFDWED